MIPDEEKPQEQVDPTAGALAAMDAGIAAVDPAPPTEAPVDAPPAADPAPEAAPAAEPAPPAQPQETTPEVEAKELGLGQKATERFKHLSQYKQALSEAGITDLAQLPSIIERAKAADEFEQVIAETGATPEQYGETIKFLSLFNGGTREQMREALKIVQAQAEHISKALGEELPGVYDPLSEHDDLRLEVESGDITRKRALEIASQRASSRYVESRSQEQAKTQQAQHEYSQAIQTLNALGAKLKASDPDYESKVDYLKPAIALIREKYPPSEWARQVAAAYQMLPKPKGASVPPPGPVRSVANPSLAATPKPKSAMEALEMGLQKHLDTGR